ncbi:enoyl-CoA hydratase/isomerase family protein [Phytohabitans sp. ZYX-F-186]|uniref:Enoyl-CoA hydratase/isomerase family protein n=1 Tax=Phytohabitans maris TaxID=3071409 RepID=A0ABU0ZPV3_9ACTN|nr:enoyl-CoA hydratase/isomerase family protein [Phytohabitans sp. ZYX-F-186]MDQ7909074.1 enoyl-CoA hydratase/isomerase family protein [Phytohabitans sp. ZYX-F-186]
MQPEVLIEAGDDGITTVTLNRPQSLNALNEPLVAGLTAALDDIRRDRRCRVVILTGSGRAFCAGLDLSGYGADIEGQMLRLFERQREIADLAHRLHELPQPVIAAVNGAAAGGGLALVCASDVRIAADGAVFAVSFIRAGYSACDIGVSWLLPRLMGAGRAHELMLTGRRFDAAEALSGGLLARVVSPDQLLASARQTATEIMRNPPASVELTKVGMWIAVETPGFRAAVEFENRQQMVAAMTEDQTEAARAFLEKRAPVYHRR